MLAGVSALTASAADTKGSGYYTVRPMFHPYPDEKAALQSIDRFGPVGIGIELLQPAFKMRVKNVEEGSPAAATGKLKKGQLIDSINGRILEDVDPRRILGDIIAKAEAAKPKQIAIR
jgi:C-terminal processing protease CtpA/Prc